MKVSDRLINILKTAFIVMCLESDQASAETEDHSIEEETIKQKHTTDSVTENKNNGRKLCRMPLTILYSIS